MSNEQNRDPKGIPSGGQFAASKRAEGPQTALTTTPALPSTPDALGQLDTVGLRYAVTYAAPGASKDQIAEYMASNAEADGPTRAASLESLREQASPNYNRSVPVHTSSYDLHDEEPDHPDAFTDDERRAIYAAMSEGLPDRNERVERLIALGRNIDDIQRDVSTFTDDDDAARALFEEREPGRAEDWSHSAYEDSMRMLYDDTLQDTLRDAHEARKKAQA